jgi:transmembrane E3 ubiquitin-protein ligase
MAIVYAKVMHSDTHASLLLLLLPIADQSCCSTLCYIHNYQAYPKAVKYSAIMTLVCIIQIGLLFKQLHYSQTAAAAARVSLLCIGQQGVLDALLCIGHLLLCAVFQPLFVAFASIAFFKLITFCIFEMRYIILIFQARQPQSYFEGGWNAMRRELAALHGRFYLTLFAVLACVWFLHWWFSIIVLALYGFWVPQIVSNVVRSSRKSLHKSYLIGMSAARLVLPLYLYACPSNFVRVIDRDFLPQYKVSLIQ